MIQIERQKLDAKEVQKGWTEGNNGKEDTMKHSEDEDNERKNTRGKKRTEWPMEIRGRKKE